MLPPPLDPKDADHLRLLVVFHCILAGLAVLGIGFLVMHFLIMENVFSNPDLWRKSPATPGRILDVLQALYFAGGLLLMASAALNLLSASFLRQRRRQTFSLVVAGLNCLQIPLGTALGVFTILVLTRDPVRQAYEG
jgi:hypothetical protein